jgi:hypothetical protein
MYCFNNSQIWYWYIFIYLKFLNNMILTNWYWEHNNILNNIYIIYIYYIIQYIILSNTIVQNIY